MNNILEATLQIKDAHNEGVTFHFLENIKEVLRDESGKVTGIKVTTWTFSCSPKIIDPDWWIPAANSPWLAIMIPILIIVIPPYKMFDL